MSVPDDPDAVPCCYGSAIYGPERCTCWEAILDREVTRDVVAGPMPAQAKCCGTCAYRAGSPERSGGDQERDVYGLARYARPFMCHAGMAVVVGWRHPDGRERPVELAEQEFRPVQRADRTWRADGQPAAVCAGWLALRRAHVASGREDAPDSVGYTHVLRTGP